MMKELQLNGERIWSVSERGAAMERRIRLAQSIGWFLIGSWLGLLVSGAVAVLVILIG